MKVSIVGENKKWMQKYPINIYDVKFELIHWYANSKNLWNAICRCLIGNTGIYLYLFSHVSFLKFADIGDTRYKKSIMTKIPCSPSQYYQLLSQEAEDGDTDLYSVQFLENFGKENSISTNS